MKKPRSTIIMVVFLAALMGVAYSCKDSSVNPSPAPNPALVDQAELRREFNMAAVDLDDTCEDSQTMAGDEAQTEPTELPSDISVAMVCQGFLAGQPEMEPYYRELKGGWIEVKSDGYDHRYFPAAVYQGDWSDFAAVVQSYRDHTQPWVEYTYTKYEDVYTGEVNSPSMIWSEDYSHQFEIRPDGDWLEMDGMEVYPTHETYDLHPQQLMAAYEAGEWNGSDRYANDHCSYAYLDPDSGTICYGYRRWVYSGENSQYAFGNKQGIKEDTPVYEDYPGVAIMSEAQEFSLSSLLTMIYADASSQYMVDLPCNYLQDHTILSQEFNNTFGSFIVTPDGIEAWHKGDQKCRWPITISEWNDHYHLVVSEWDLSDNYLICPDRVIQLLPDGKQKVVADSLVGVSYGWEYNLTTVSLKEDHLVIGWRTEDGWKRRKFHSNVAITDAAYLGGKLIFKTADGRGRYIEMDWTNVDQPLEDQPITSTVVQILLEAVESYNIDLDDHTEQLLRQFANT